MKYIDTNWDVPFYNFAFEEYLMSQMPEDSYVFFYIHEPSIIVGKHQNTIEEINKEFVDANNIVVARRLSGGGAVYHDKGNLNFSFIHKADKSDVNNFVKFTEPVIKALNKLGVNAELSGRNDILIDGKKISGNAQYYKNGRLLHHGTLLFNADMSNLVKALNVKELKIKSKGIKSVRSRVGNIKDYMNTKMTIYEFKDFLLENFYKSSEISKYVLTDNDIAYVNKNVEEKFSTWDWNWGESPEFEIQKIKKFKFGLVDLRLNVKRGKIKDCKIYGDFFTKEDITILEQQLIGILYKTENLKQTLIKMNLNDYFAGITVNEFIRFIFE